MLVQFSVENYRSILRRQPLSMAASRDFEALDSSNTLDPGAVEPVPHLLRSTGIYGPNASGKSTLVRALDFMRDRVIHSAKESQANEDIAVEPFKLTAASRSGESEFEVIFVEDGVRYQYGFRCNQQQVKEEWLFAYPEGRAQRWFQRVLDTSSKQDKYRFSASFLGGRKRQTWKEQTRSNALFLSTALQLNNEQLKPVLNWFQQRLRIMAPHLSFRPGYTIRRCLEDIQKQRILEFLNAADISIADIHIQSQVFSPDLLPKDLPTVLRDEVSRQMEGKDMVEVRFLHEDVEVNVKSHQLIEFKQDEESDGTRALFAFAGPWLDVLENDRILVVDELDTSLHPLIVHQLVKLFHQYASKAQLIFTTHDTTILSQKLLRRDQIWFMEKDDKHSTQLYSLADFTPRDNEIIERSYLNGRYGGIPFLKDLDFYGKG